MGGVELVRGGGGEKSDEQTEPREGGAFQNPESEHYHVYVLIAVEYPDFPPLHNLRLTGVTG
jgi:hypothetical protein